jgi:hypothetical protein
MSNEHTPDTTEAVDTNLDYVGAAAMSAIGGLLSGFNAANLAGYALVDLAAQKLAIEAAEEEVARRTREG